jgi:glutamine synthetase adenylyltransferase
MRERISIEHGVGNPLKHAPGGLLDIEFVVQLGLLLNANQFPQIIHSTLLEEQLIALRDCRWINKRRFETLDSVYTRLIHARQQVALVDDGAKAEGVSLSNAAQALCDEILR